MARDLSALSVDALQAEYAAVAPQVQRLTGWSAAVLAELQARTGGVLATETGGRAQSGITIVLRSRCLPSPPAGPAATAC